MQKILLIEDTVQMQKYICDFLVKQGYDVKVLDDYDNILNEIELYCPNLILLDITLPKYDGFFYLKLIRKHYDIPVFIISARDDESEQVRGLENGANDYITKPFSVNILLAKINGLFNIQNSNKNEYKRIKVNNLVIDSNTLCAQYKENKIELTKNEFKILLLLVERKNEIISRNELLEQLWDDSSFVEDNTLTVNISRLKKKLEYIGLSDVILSKRGVGYIFVYN